MISPHVDVKTFDSEVIPNLVSKYNSVKVLYTLKGEANKLTLVNSILDFKIKFGKPNKTNICDWYQVYNYFLYNNKSLYICRSLGENSFNAQASAPNKFKENIRIDNYEDFLAKNISLENNVIKVFAKTPGEWGNSIEVAIFTLQDLRQNVKIHKNYFAKNIVNIFKEGQYCIAVFYEKRLVEYFLIDYNDIEKVNGSSEYIYLKNNFLDYKIFDGNLYWIDGDELIADGNLQANLKPVFYGSNILKLENGISEEPSKKDFFESNEIIKEENIDLTFVMCDKNYPDISINLAEHFNAIALVQLKNSDVFDLIQESKLLDKSYARNIICYANTKKQTDIYTNKDYYFSIIGDLNGLREYLIENYSLNESHCKRIYSISEILNVSKKYTNDEIDELYLNNINVIKKDNNDFIFNSENMLNGEKLSQRLPIIKLEKRLQELSLYYVFEFNNEFTRYNLYKLAQQIGDEAVTKRYITDYRIVCDLTNNKENSEYLNLDFYFKPNHLIEEIKINLRIQNS